MPIDSTTAVGTTRMTARLRAALRWVDDYTLWAFNPQPPLRRPAHTRSVAR